MIIFFIAGALYFGRLDYKVGYRTGIWGRGARSGCVNSIKLKIGIGRPRRRLKLNWNWVERWWCGSAKSNDEALLSVKTPHDITHENRHIYDIYTGLNTAAGWLMYEYTHICRIYSTHTHTHTRETKPDRTIVVCNKYRNHRGLMNMCVNASHHDVSLYPCTTHGCARAEGSSKTQSDALWRGRRRG